MNLHQDEIITANPNFPLPTNEAMVPNSYPGKQKDFRSV